MVQGVGFKKEFLSLNKFENGFGFGKKGGLESLMIIESTHLVEVQEKR